MDINVKKYYLNFLNFFEFFRSEKFKTIDMSAFEG